MKKYEKILKVNLIVSAVVWNILIVVLCLDFGKKYLAIILGIEIIIELNFLIIYLTGRNLGEEKKVEYSSITKRHSVMKVRIVFVIFKKIIMVLLKLFMNL